MKIYKLAALITAAVLLLSLCSCGSRQSEIIEAPEVTGEFYAQVLDIGKADAIVLRSGDNAALIDCGETKDGDNVLEHLKASGIDRLDCLIITHFDKDHVGGAAEILRSIEVESIITPKYEGTNQEYLDYIAAARDKNITPTELDEITRFTLSDTLFEVYPPQKTYYKEGDNDFSLVVSVTHGDNKFLFAGDAEEERLSELSSQLNLEHSFLKVPHHGKYNKNTEAFLKRVNSDTAVITCSKKNPPDSETLEVLSGIGSKVYLTEDGTVTAVSDGKSIEITQQ